MDDRAVALSHPPDVAALGKAEANVDRLGAALISSTFEWRSGANREEKGKAKNERHPRRGEAARA